MSIILCGSQSNVCPNLIITVNVSNIYLCKSTNKKQILKVLCLLKLCIKLRKLFKLKNMSLICSFKGPLNTLFSICRMIVESTTTENLLQEKVDVFNLFSHLISKVIFYVGKITVCEKDLCETVYTVLVIFSVISLTLFK